MVKKKKKGVKKKPSIKKTQNKQLVWIVGVMIALILVFLITNSIFRNLNKFEYNDLTFTKTKLGEIDLYHYYYYFDDEEQIYQNNIYLRNDPRVLDAIPVEGGNIVYPRGRLVYVTSNNTGLLECPESTLAVAQLANFLTNNQLTVRAGTLIEEEARNEAKHITCEIRPDSPVIEISKGSETKIEISDTCYRITANNCEILEVVERFMVQSIIDARDN